MNILLYAAVTIAVTKIALFFAWNTAFMSAQKTDSWHHIYTGFCLVLVTYFLPRKYARLGYGIGLGLILDEIHHLGYLLGISECVDYWSRASYLSTGVSFLALLVGVLFYNRWQRTS